MDTPIEFVSASDLCRRAGVPLPTGLNRLRRKSIQPDGVLISIGISKAPWLLYLKARETEIVNEIRQ